jgi:hypothetical protein
MKKIITICCIGIYLILGLGSAQAADTKGPRILFAKTQDKNWSTMEKWIEENKLGENGYISRSGIILLSFTDARDKDLLGLMIAAKQTEQAYGESFMRFNGLVGRNGRLINRMSYRKFREQGQREGFYAPVMTAAEKTLILSQELVALKTQVDANKISNGEKDVAIAAAQKTLNDVLAQNATAVEKLTASNKTLLSEVSWGFNNLRKGNFTPEAVDSLKQLIAKQVKQDIDSLKKADQLAAVEREEMRVSMTKLDQVTNQRITSLNDKVDAGLAATNSAVIAGLSKVNDKIEAQRVITDSAINAERLATDNKINSGLETANSRLENTIWIGSGIALLVAIGLMYNIHRKTKPVLAKIEALDGKISQVEEVASEALNIAYDEGCAISVEFGHKNLRQEELRDLLNGQENAVLWTGIYDNKSFAIKLWREEGLRKDLIFADIIRSTKSGQKVDPISISRLQQKVTYHVRKGVIPLKAIVQEVKEVAAA